MSKVMRIFLGVCLALVCAEVAAAQESRAHKPPQILTITREFVKPGKTGPAHEKAESLYVEAFERAKWPTHYIGMESLSGKARALFFVGYESFEAWEKDAQATARNEALSAGIAHADAVDGELLESKDLAAWYYEEEGSYNSAVDIASIRCFEIERFTIRQGHEKEWNEAVKLVKTALAKSRPDSQWAMYAAVYGVGTPTHIVITPLKSAAEIDRAFANNPKFAAAMGEDGMKRLDELSAAAIESSETNLFTINPKMSYPAEDWVKANPEFWKPKAAAPAAPKKSAKKPDAKP